MTKQAGLRQFTVIIHGVEELTDDMVDRLFEAGCDDCSPGMTGGIVHLHFDREADSMMDAITSAFANIASANIGGTIWRIDESDLVAAVDIAKRLGKSKQYIHKLIQGEKGDGTFPDPDCHYTGRNPLWKWTSVTKWMHEKHKLPDSVVQDAKDIEQINLSLELQRLEAKSRAVVNGLATRFDNLFEQRVKKKAAKPKVVVKAVAKRK